MLDIMRRKKRLKAILWLVIVSLGLGMVLFFIPAANVGTGNTDTTAASVADESIPMTEYVQAYQRMLQNYTRGGANRPDPELLKAMGLDRQVLDSLIGLHVVNYAAKRLGLDVVPEEIRSAVENNPNLMDNGQFIGIERYKMLLAQNNISVGEFEESLRNALLTKKVRQVVSDAVTISDGELRDEFVRTNQEAQVAYVIFKKDDFKKNVKSTEPDLQAYFNAHKDKYNIKEQRRAQYLLIPSAAVATTISVTDKEVQEEWARQPHPETVTASHILFKVDDAAKDAEVKTKAEEVLKRAKAGEDFAELARKYSQDTESAKNGGDLGSFPRDQMVKEFSDAAFTMKPGEISGLVRTQFGYHIIKVTSHETPTLESSRKAVEQAIKQRKATDIVKQKGQDAQRLSASQKDLNAIAKALNVSTEIRETPLMARDADPYANGVSQPMLDEIFQLKDLNAIGKSVEVPLGYALPKLAEVQLPKPPNFADARAAVEKDYADVKALELARAESKKFSDEASKAGDIEKAAQKQKLAVKTSQSFKRDGQVDAEIGSAYQISAAAFESPVGSIGAPVELDGGNKIAVLQVKSRTAFDDAAFNKQKNEIRDRLLSYQQDAYFQEYIRRVQDDLTKEKKIRINPKAIEQIAQIRY